MKFNSYISEYSLVNEYKETNDKYIRVISFEDPAYEILTAAKAFILKKYAVEIDPVRRGDDHVTGGFKSQGMFKTKDKFFVLSVSRKEDKNKLEIYLAVKGTDGFNYQVLSDRSLEKLFDDLKIPKK